MKRWISLAVFVLLFALAYTHVAWAGSECGRVVTDNAHVLKNTFNVSVATNELANTGADSRVVVMPNLGNTGNLDRMEKQIERGCPEWQNANGGRKNNLVVLMLSVKEHKAGLYYGSMYKSLDQHWLRIATELMKPKLRDGDYDGALIGALGEITRVTQAALHPELVGNPVSIRPTPSAEPQPMSEGMKYLSAMVLFFGLSTFFIVWISRRAARRSIQREARMRAQLQKQQAASQISKIDEMVQLAQTHVASTLKTVSDEDALPFKTLLSDLKQHYDQATIDFGSLEDTAAGNPNQQGLTAEEYDTIAASYGKIVKDVNQVPAILTQIEVSIKELDTLPQAVAANKKTLEENVSALATKKKLLDAMTQEFGARSVQEVADALQLAEQNLAKIGQLISEAEKSYSQEKRSVKTVRDSLGYVNQLVAKTTGILRAIDSRNAQLVQAKKNAPTAIQNAQNAIDQTTEYVQSYPENQTAQKRQRLQAATQLVLKARAMLTETQPDYTQITSLVGMAQETAQKITAELEEWKQSELREERRKQAEAAQQLRAQQRAEEDRRRREREIVTRHNYSSPSPNHTTTNVVVINEEQPREYYAPPSYPNNYGGDSNDRVPNNNDDDNNSGGGGSISYSEPDPTPASSPDPDPAPDNSGGGGSTEW